MDGFVPLETQKLGQNEKFGRIWVCERKENGSERRAGGGAATVRRWRGVMEMGGWRCKEVLGLVWAK
jgi:hypothetical protein